MRKLKVFLTFLGVAILASCGGGGGGGGGGSAGSASSSTASVSSSVASASSASTSSGASTSSSSSTSSSASSNPIAASYAQLSPSRINAIAAMLPASPAGMAPACSDRASWGAAAIASRLSAVITDADKKLLLTFPAWSDTDYLDYSKTGSRTQGEAMMNARKAWIYPLVLAECVQYQGKYLAAIENTLNELAQQPTWTWPAHDTSLNSYKGIKYFIDLMAADTANEMAQALYLLGDKISPTVRQKVMVALETRIFTPLRSNVETGSSHHWWLKDKYNWNAVCLKGAIGAALAVLPDPRYRAIFVATGESYISNYINGFTDDGYTTEGPGYWNYGYGHFVELREMITRATQNQIDLFANAKVRNMALYGARIEMFPNNIAAFSDTSPTTKIDPFALGYSNETLGLGLTGKLANLSISASQSANSAPLSVASTTLFATPYVRGGAAAVLDPLRSYFSDVGILVTRPATGSGNKIAASIKSGGNGSHSHNDIGSYSIALNAEQPTGDVGRTAYTSKTFSSERYTIKAINSYGHPVPVVDGQLQIEATTVKHKVLATNFTDAADDITIDLKPAYNVATLQSLTRTLRHERASGGSISIRDDFAYSSARSFETALTTRGSWQQNAADTLELWQKNEHLLAKIEASNPYDIVGETITEEGITYTRIAIRLKNAQQTGWVKVTMQAK